MPLPWNEIRHRSIAFSRDHKHDVSEKSERQTFWNEFFNVFGLRRKHVASFEEPVKNLSGNTGFIDLFWPGKVIIEHKSRGEDLSKAHAQGMGYVRALIDSGREKEAPRYLIVSDFHRIALHDLEPEPTPDGARRAPTTIEFHLRDLHKHIRHFAFIPGYKQHRLNPEDPANIEAAEIMAKLHDALHLGGFRGHELRVFLVRVLFCLFAEDTGVFNQKDFQLYLENHTADDGSDTGPKLAQLFHILNTPEDQRQQNLDEDLAAFPYINGELFAEPPAFPAFHRDMRAALISATRFRWEKISPAVFGSLFQGVMDAIERRQIGAHYTAEKNILKLIRPLFLDALRAEFDAAKADKSTRRTARLEALHQKLATLKFLDPACGCGNFLVITYRELRALELEILIELHSNELSETQHEFSFDVSKLTRIDVDQMYGIEIEEFPARIAEVALWLTDHQANLALSEAFGQLFRRIPLRKSPHITCGNALQIPWESVLPKEDCDFILGNPPFVGKHYQSAEQKEDLRRVWKNASGTGVLDFVTAWHALAASYMYCAKPIRCAFVSTNSICQGEQASILWSRILAPYGHKIHFAHRTFSWESEARGKAHVHCIIVGFGHPDAWGQLPKLLYDYENNPDQPSISTVTNISPYLVEGSDQVVISRTCPLCPVPEMTNGSKPVDGGHLILSDDERNHLVAIEPAAAAFIRPLVGSEEFINRGVRWCLWLAHAEPAQLRAMPEVMKRIEGVKAMRLASADKSTRQNASRPSLFSYIRQPLTRYLAIPEVSSENRQYVPMAFLDPEIVCTNKIQYIPNASNFVFGVLTSKMHMAWMRQVCGRLKSDYSYSKNLVYNNYPWPDKTTEAQIASVEKAAQAVLDARDKHRGSTLADLYDPVSMPPNLAKAHEALDQAVDRCYRKEKFPGDRQRVEHLFALYETLTAPLVKPAKRKK